MILQPYNCPPPGPLLPIQKKYITQGHVAFYNPLTAVMHQPGFAQVTKYHLQLDNLST